MNYKDVCGSQESVWFELSDKKEEGRRFLQWAKELGCVWMNGEEIDPKGGTDFFTLCIARDGKLYNVPAMLKVSKQSVGVKRINFGEYCKVRGKNK